MILSVHGASGSHFIESSQGGSGQFSNGIVGKLSVCTYEFQATPGLLQCCSKHQRNDRIEKTCQHGAMKHPKQNKWTPQTHPSALAVPSYHRILVKHGLIERTLSIPDAYEVFLKVGANPEVQKLRRKVAHGNRMKHVPALYLATAMALQGMTKQELEALKLRIKEKRV